MPIEAIIWTEGKTDWHHLKRAFEVLGVGSSMIIKEFDGDLGDDQLYKQCIAFARAPQPYPNIFLFDRDKPDIVNKIENSKGQYKSWGNNVFSLALPIPAHRSSQPGVCIEMYYTDDEVRTQDSSGRRLFLSSEFNPISGRHNIHPELSIGNKGKLPHPGKNMPVQILDSEIYDQTNHNIALSKADFASNIFKGVGAFKDLNFSSFNLIYRVIETIVKDSSPRIDLIFGDISVFCAALAVTDKPERFTEIVKAAIRICKLSTMCYVAAIIRYYEQRIITETTADKKKVRPIKETLTQSFGQPSLLVLQKLAKQATHLLDENAPSTLFTLRAMMQDNPVLGSVGNLLDHLEKIFPPPRHQARVIDKHKLRKPILDYVVLEFAKYEDRLAKSLEGRISSAIEGLDANIWDDALMSLIGAFAPLTSLIFRIRDNGRIKNSSGETEVLLTTYKNKSKTVTELTKDYGDIAIERLETYEIVATTDETEESIDIFPFLIIKHDRIHYYNRIGAQGYEYISIFGDIGHREATKRKFSHLALRSTTATDMQSRFWAQVTPTMSAMGVKANIPTQEPFVGRKQQIADIMQQVIQIPNQNGIIYGPGGVGKTALLIEVTRQLYEEGFSDQAYFTNIIWVSAKENYYDPVLDLVETGAPRFTSLDNVLTAILDFHEYEEPINYDRENKKGLVVELLRDQETLLILDNFESVIRSEQEEIIKFFGLEVKRALRDRPGHFKVLITSRELIPSAFQQMDLKGLDQNESKELMDRLYQPYAGSRDQLTEEQRDALYLATKGIPLVIKHCYGQLYEFSLSLDVVLAQLSIAGNKVIEFSFSEMLKLLKQDDLQLRLILLLEIIGRPLMLRQMADILGKVEIELTERITRLVKYQCASRSSVGMSEKYTITNEAQSFARALVREYPALASEIKKQIANLTIEKRLDYSKEEYDIARDFQTFVNAGRYLPAEDFIKDKLKEYPESLILNLEYAKYLKEKKARTEEAIQRLEYIRGRSGNDQQVLRLLMTYYSALDIPDFDQADIYARELQEVAAGNAEIRMELARFYVGWSTAEKIKYELDPLRNIVRQQRYKELAAKAIKLLENIMPNTHEKYHLLAQSYYNRWDYISASRHAEAAITHLPNGSDLKEPYRRLRMEIRKKQNEYSGRNQ